MEAKQKKERRITSKNEANTQNLHLSRSILPQYKPYKKQKAELQKQEESTKQSNKQKTNKNTNTYKTRYKHQTKHPSNNTSTNK